MDACAEGIWEGPQNGGSTGTLGAMQEVWITVYQHLPVAELWRSEDNLGYDYLYGQATEAQLSRFYCCT